MAKDKRSDKDNKMGRDYNAMSDAELITIIGDVDPGTNRADLIILAEQADHNR